MELLNQPEFRSVFADFMASNPSKQVIKEFLTKRANSFVKISVVGTMPRSLRRAEARRLGKKFTKKLLEERNNANLGL